MREQLIELADQINTARIAANACDWTAPQAGVYGDLSRALARTLELLVGMFTAETVYQACLDGATPSEAIRLITE